MDKKSFLVMNAEDAPTVGTDWLNLWLGGIMASMTWLPTQSRQAGRVISGVAIVPANAGEMQAVFTGITWGAASSSLVIEVLIEASYDGGSNWTHVCSFVSSPGDRPGPKGNPSICVNLTGQRSARVRFTVDLSAEAIIGLNGYVV